MTGEMVTIRFPVHLPHLHLESIGHMSSSKASIPFPTLLDPACSIQSSTHHHSQIRALRHANSQDRLVQMSGTATVLRKRRMSLNNRSTFVHGTRYRRLPTAPLLNRLVYPQTILSSCLRISTNLASQTMTRLVAEAPSPTMEGQMPPLIHAIPEETLRRPTPAQSLHRFEHLENTIPAKGHYPEAARSTRIRIQTLMRTKGTALHLKPQKTSQGILRRLGRMNRLVP